MQGYPDVAGIVLAIAAAGRDKLGAIERAETWAIAARGASESAVEFQAWSDMANMLSGMWLLEKATRNRRNERARMNRQMRQLRQAMA